LATPPSSANRASTATGGWGRGAVVAPGFDAADPANDGAEGAQATTKTASVMDRNRSGNVITPRLFGRELFLPAV
jgi:hypothetical protein